MDYYVGEIRLFVGKYPPAGWHYCDGSLLSVSTYPALFSLLGTTYGGNGSTTFGLPDLRGRVPVGQGQGTGLTNRVLGQSGGSSTVTLTQAQIPPHNHGIQVSNKQATTPTIDNNVGFAAMVPPTSPATNGRYVPATASPAPVPVNLDAAAMTNTGGGQPHNNLMPYMALTYMISLDGTYPVRP